VLLARTAYAAFPHLLYDRIPRAATVSTLPAQVPLVATARSVKSPAIHRRKKDLHYVGRRQTLLSVARVWYL